MKTMHSLASIAVLAAACIALPAASADSPLERALSSSGSRPLILAQYEKPRATCKDDERNLPRGSMICREGKVFQCNTYGQWENTGKPC
jgi:hypothetical protein